MPQKPCSYWAQGRCRNGESCRFLHNGPAGGSANQTQSQPRNQSNYYNGRQQQQSSNRNTLLDRVENGPSPLNNRQLSTGPPRDSHEFEDYGITPSTIQAELLKERPIWIMSAYGPGRSPPIQLFGGELIEQSPEEVRFLYYQALATNSVPQYQQYEAELAARSNQQVQLVSADSPGALKYLRSGENQHPNRNDICAAGTTHKARNGEFSVSNRAQAIRNQAKSAPQYARGFGTASIQPQNVAQQAGFGGGFGGNITAPQVQPMVQPSLSNSGFGQPQQVNRGFSYPQPGFNQAQQSNIQPPFGQGMPQMGNTLFPQTVMAQAPQTSNPAPFGQLQTIQQPDFGGLAQPVNQSNGIFPGQQPQSQSSFGQPPAHSMANVTNDSGFAGTRPNTMTNGTANAKLSAPAPAVSLPATQGDLSTYTTRDGNGRLLTWKGKHVKYMEGTVPCYQREDGTFERIWFPEGPPQPAASNSMAHVQYSEEATEAYKFLSQNGTFQNGVVPDVAPRLDMIRFDC